MLSAATARTEPGRRFMNRLARFQEWAERNDATLESGHDLDTDSESERADDVIDRLSVPGTTVSGRGQ